MSVKYTTASILESDTIMPNSVPGVLWIYFQNAILVTIPVSFILLVWYRHAVSRGMRTLSAEAGELTLDDGAPRDPVRTSLDAAKQARLRLRLAVIYAVAGAVAAGVLTALFFTMSVEFAALRAFTVWYTFCWPILPTVAVLLALSRRRAFVAFLIYVAAGMVLVAGWTAFNKIVLGRTNVVALNNAMAFLTFLFQEAWLPYLVILVTGNRKLRSVSPLALAGLLVFSYSAIGVNYAVVALMDVRTAGNLLLVFGGANVQRIIFLLAALPVGLGCWLGLRLLGRGFERKSFSDVQLLVDTWWLIVIFNAAILFSSDLGWGGLLCLLAFVAYRTVVEICFRLWRIPPAGEYDQRLLLLRVFGFQRRTEKLFDGIAQRWRFDGNVKVIAGADLVARLIDPGDFITFVGGRLRQQFVENSADLVRKLGSLDERRDPDGRFRVNEFFCRDNTWRPTLQALLKRSDVVLMDLRGFSERNSGCQFELQQLAANSLLARTVFVVDDTTDSKLLEASLDGLGRIHLVHTKTQSAAETQAIYRALQTI